MASYLIQSSAVHGFCTWGAYLKAILQVTLAASSTSPSCGEIGQRLYASALVFALLGGGLGFYLGSNAKISEGALRGAQRAVAGIALAMSLGVMVYLNYFDCTTDSEPYVYVQTYNDIFRLTNPVMALAREEPRLLWHGGTFHPHQHLSFSLASG